MKLRLSILCPILVVLQSASPVRADIDSKWKQIALETFEEPLATPAPWEKDRCAPSGPFSDCGSYFTDKGIIAPPGYRSIEPLAHAQEFTVSSYSRTQKDLSLLRSVVDDPSGRKNKVLMISSPEHTDATIVRSSDPLPTAYRVCLDVGYADFGNGNFATYDLNGYKGGERAAPWLNMDATKENGFYWLAILDTMPYPRNNVWIHHQRKIVIDTDNNKEAWTEIWNGKKFVHDGRHPLTMFAISSQGQDDPRIGKPFISFSAGILQPEGLVRAVDAYLDSTWYHVCIEKSKSAYTLMTSGKYRFGGETTYRVSVPLERVKDATTLPDYFMCGDPHINFYRGKVHFDNILLEVPEDS